MQTLPLPEKRHVASFDVDAQNTFTPLCPEELPVPNGTEIVHELNAQAQFAVVRLGSKDAHSPQAVWVANHQHPQLSPLENVENADVYWKAHAVPGTLGFELISGLPKITEYDFFVWKGVEPDMHPYGACFHDFAEKMSTGVIEFLRDRNITTVLVGGLATDFCVKKTVLELLNAGFQVIVNLAACRGLSADTTQRAVELMREKGAVFVSCAAELKQSA